MKQNSYFKLFISICYNSSLNFSATVEAPQILEMFPAYYIFNGLFSILLILHVVWTYFIYKVAYRSFTKYVRTSSKTFIDPSNNWP